MYVRDTGLLHSLLSIDTEKDLASHPKLGASWEGFVIEQILAIMGVENAYYWSTYSGAEIDLLIFKKGKRLGFEFKCSDAPRMTKSIHNAMDDLKLDKVFVVYPGKESYRIAKNVEVISVLDTNSLA